jgi:hypothetical protein
MAFESAVPPQRSGAQPARAAPRETAIPAWADGLTHWLDEAIRIPGTNIRIGLDAVLGFFVPGLGDAASGVASVSLLVLALRRGVPRVVLARMIANLGIDALVGAVPLLGDLFDVGFKANRKNLELIKRHELDPTAKPRSGDYLLVIAGIALVFLAIALPIVLVTLLASGLFSELSR